MHTFKRQTKQDNQAIQATRPVRSSKAFFRDSLFRAGQWLVYWLFWAGMVWAAFAQGVTTTTVQGTVYLANGQPATGSLLISWPSFTTSTGQAVAAGKTTAAIGADGFVSVNLTPNQGAYPGGLFYTVVYYLSDSSVHTEYWTVPAAAQTTIGAVRAQIMPAAQAVQAVNKAYVDQAIAEATGSDLSTNGGSLTGPLYLSGDPTTPLQAADKHYVDGQFALALPLAGGAATGPLTATQLGAVYQVDQFPGTDIGAKLQACVNNLNSTFGGVCDARNFPGTLTIASNITISTPNAVIDLPCATITTSAQFIVTAGTRNVAVHGCGFQGGSTASGTQGGTVWVYTGSSNAFQIGDMTGAANTPGFYMHDLNINTANAGAAAVGIYFKRAQEVRLDGIYLNGNGTTGQTGVTLDGTGNYTGGTFVDVYINGFGTGWLLTGDNVGNFANASTFVKTHVVCPTNAGTPIPGTIGVNVAEADGNTWSGGDVESCSTMFHLGANAINNTVNGLRNENSTIQYQADAGSKWNAVFTGGTFYTGELIDNGSRNSFWDAFHRNTNGIKGDWYASQQDATVTNHVRVGTGQGNERGILNEIQTDYGYRWEEGYADAMGSGFQTWSIQDLLNNVSRVAVGQYLSPTANVVTNIVLNNGGCYISNTPPTITISGATGTGATAIASMAASTSLSCNGGAGFQVSSVAVTSGGSGYLTPPTVTFAGANQLAAPNSVAEVVSSGGTNNQTVLNSAGTGAVVLNGSNNAGTGGVVIGSGGATSTAVATISNAGNAQFYGNLTVNGTSLSAGTLNVKNSADAEVDYYLQPGLTTSQKGSFTYKDYTGASQWYMVKDASNNWALNSATGNIDSFKAYQSTNSGDTYVDSSNTSGHIRLNYESGAGSETDIYSSGSANLDAAFLSPTLIKFPGLAATSGKYCLQIDNSGYLSNTGTACGSGTGSTTGTINSGTSGQVAVYSSTGTTIAGLSTLPLTSGGTGATTASAALTSLGAQAALPGVATNGSNGITITGSVSASAVSSSTSISSANNVISVMAPPYNATCNLVQYSSGSIALNSAVLTGTGFTSALVGRKIIVWGAGANNGTTSNPNYGPLITTVASYQGATQITLSATASATVPNNSNNPGGNFEIGTDDTAAVQAAYNAAGAAKATLLFPATQGNNSCLIGAIDLSGGGTQNHSVPILGQGSAVSSVTGLPGQDVFLWPDGRPISAAYSFVKGLQINVDSSLDVSGSTGSYPNRVTGMAANGSGGLTAMSPAIAPGPVNFIGGAISTSSDGTYDQLTVATPATNGGEFNQLPSWMVIGMPVSIPAIGLSATVTSVASGANGASQITFAPAYSGAASNLSGTWGTGIAPPWYIGNCGFAVPGSNGLNIGGPQMMFEDVTFKATAGTPAMANHTCAMFFQQPPYRSRFTRITAQNLYYGYVEALPTSNNNGTWTPDTSTYHDFDTNVLIPFIQYAGNHRIIDGLNIYAGAPFAVGPFFLNGPLNSAGGSTVTHFYEECWSANSGENQRWQGGNWTIVAGSMTQCGGPYVAWQANRSFVTDALIGGPGIASPATAGLQLSGNGNTFLAVTLALNANASVTAQVNDTGVGNTVTANSSNLPALAVRANLPHCIPGEFDGSFLSGFTASPFTSRCGLMLDYSTSLVNGPGAGSVSYKPSVAGDGNPAPGYWYTSSGTGTVQINASGQPWAVGSRVPQTSQMYLVVGGKVGTAGSQSFAVYDNTAGTTLAACSFTFSTANTFSIHGQKAASDACAFSTASVPAGDVLIVQYSPSSALGAESIGFVAFVPADTDPKSLASGSTATTQTSTDASTLVATDAFVHNAIASQTGYQLTEWVTGGTRSLPGVSFSANATQLFSFELPGSLSASKISYTPSTADASSSDYYDLGIYNASGTLVCHLGATPGSTFAPNTSTMTLSFASTCNLVGGIRYYLGITASSATATLTSAGAMLMAAGGFSPANGTTTTGGALNSSVTLPADGWSAYATMPQISLHN